AERADLATPAVAVEVVALSGSGGGHQSVSWSVGRQKGRSSRSDSSDGGRVGRTLPPAGAPDWPPSAPPEHEPAPGPAAAPAKEPSSSRLRRSRFTIESAVISREVRFWPSRPSNSRVLKRPSTKTLLPLRRFSAARSARSPHTLMRNQSVASTHSPVCWFFVLWFTATLNWVTGRPLGVYRISGSAPRLPMIMTLQRAIVRAP